MFNVVQVDEASFRKKRKFHISACTRCHERKVKCDSGFVNAVWRPCKNCSTTGETCRSHVDGRSKSTAKACAQPAISAEDRNSDSDNSFSNSPNHLYGADSSAAFSLGITTPPDPEPEAILMENSSAVADGHPHWVQDALVTRHFGASEEGCHSDMSTRQSLAIPIMEEHSAANIGLSPPQEQIRHPEETIGIPSLPLNRFEAYVEDTLGSYAPRFHGPLQTKKPLEPPWGHQKRPSSQDSFGLPRPINVNMSSRSTLDLEIQTLTLDEADMAYLKAKGAFDLPPRALQEELVEAYFTDVHPTAPVINRARFLRSFYGGGSPSRLLLFSIFTSGSRACRNPALLDSKGTNQGSAQRFYKATRALLDTGYEQDRLVRVQSLLLLTWWWDKKDDGGRNMRACAVDAINTAQSLGLHRWDHYPKDDIVMRRLWKRIWWTCFNRDVAVAVSHGLPCVLSSDHFDVHPLSPEDFNEELDVPEQLLRWPYKPVEVAFSIQIIRVAESLHHIHMTQFVADRLHPSMTVSIAGREAFIATTDQSSHPPGVKSAKIGFWDNYNDPSIQLCRRWLDDVPDIARYDADNVQSHEFWPAFLHILYYTNIMLRFREKAVSRPTTDRGEKERVYCQSRGIAAASMVTKIMRNVRAHNHVLRFTGQITITLFNCLTFFLVEGQSRNKNVRRDAQTKYSLCLHMLYEFSQLWVSASLVHRLFEALQARMQLDTPVKVLSASSKPPIFASDHLETPLPGLKISSEVTEPYIRHLLSIEFHYEDNMSTAATLVQPSPGVETNLSSPSADAIRYFFDANSEAAPDLSIPLGGADDLGLDVTQWIDFFELGDSTAGSAQKQYNFEENNLEGYFIEEAEKSHSYA